MKNKITTFNPIRLLKKALVVTLATCSLSLASFANAALIGVTLQSSPDIVSSFINVSYTESTDALSANGFATSYFDGTTSHILSGGLFTLDATIDGMGVFSVGTLSISDSTGALLTGNITDFGFDPSGTDPLEFLFTATGGSLSAGYGSNGAVILVSSGITASLFSTDFLSTPFSGVADTGIVAVPEPTALLLMGMGLIGFTLKRRSL